MSYKQRLLAQSAYGLEDEAFDEKLQKDGASLQKKTYPQ